MDAIALWYTMNRFLSPLQLQSQETLVLDGAEAHHLTHVLRKSVGDSILIVDGYGGVATAKIIDIKKKQVEVSINSIEIMPPPPPLLLAFGISKPPALEFMLRRCTEVGVTEFQPLITQHSQSEKHWNSARWDRIVREVCKQCESCHFPKLSSPMKLAEFLDVRDHKMKLFYCSEVQRKSESYRVSHLEGVHIVIGSEGGWSKEELIELQKSAGSPLGLGPNRLRTETAALMAVARVQMMMDIAML